MNWRTILFVLFPLLVSTISFGQLKSILDSLNRELKFIKEDTSLVQLYASIAMELYSSNPKSSLEYIQKGLDLSQKMNYHRGKALCLSVRGVWHYFQGENGKSMQSYYLSLKICDQYGFLDLKGITLSRIGDIEREEGNLTKAMAHQKEAIGILRKNNNPAYLLYALQRIGLLLVAQKKFDPALIHYQEALKLAKANRDIKQEAITWYYIAEVYLKQEKFDLAGKYFEKCIELNKIAGSLILEASALNHLTTIQIKTGLLDKALEVSRKALSVALPVNAKSEIENAYFNHYLIFKQKNISDSALNYYEKAVLLKDSLFNENKNKLIRQLQSDYEMQKKETALQQQTEIIRNKNYLLIAAFLIISLILSMALLIYRNQLQQKKAFLLLHQKQQEIVSQSEELKALNDEMSSLNEHLEDVVRQRTAELDKSITELLKQNQDMEQFSFIVSHNLRAPVARILGLVSILEKNEINGEYNLGIIRHLENVSLDLDTIIKDLTQVITIRNGKEQENEPVNLKQLTMTTFTFFNEELSKNNIYFAIEDGENVEVYSVKSYLQSIIYNLISNAIKYRNPLRPLEILIKIAENQDYLIYSIQDNGLGIDLKKIDPYKIFGLYQRMHIHVEGKGLGLFLVKTQLDALGGKIEVESEVDIGSTFTVYLPLQLKENDVGKN